MTPNLLRSVAAAGLAAALIPAQEVHDVIVRTKKVDGTKASKKSTDKHAATHKKMMKLIERMGSDDVSSAERKKLKKTLIKMLSHKTGDLFYYTDKGKKAKKGSVVFSETEPGLYAWVSEQGPKIAKAKSDGKKSKASYAWVTDLNKPHGKQKSKAKGEGETRVMFAPHGEWLGVVQGKGKKDAGVATAWVSVGDATEEVKGYKLDGSEVRFLGVQDPKKNKKKGYVRFGTTKKDGDKKIDAIVTKPSKGMNGYWVEYHKATDQDPKKSQSNKKSLRKKKATEVMLSPTVTQLRGTLIDPSHEHEVVTLIEGGDAPVVHYHKADGSKGKSKKPRTIAYEVADKEGLHVFYSSDEKAKEYKKHKGQLLHTYRFHDQDPQKSKSKKKTYTKAYTKSARSPDTVQITVRGKDGKVRSYTGSSKDDLGKKVHLLMQGHGHEKKSKKSPRGEYVFEWTSDDGKSKKKGGKDHGFFTIEADVDLEFDGTKAKTDKLGRFSFDVGDLKVHKAKTDKKGLYSFDVGDLKVHQFKKSKKDDEVSFEVVVEAEDEKKGRGALLKLLNSDGGDQKHGALLKLLGKDDRVMRVAKSPKGEMWATIVLEDEDGKKRKGRWVSEISEDALIKHIHGDHEDIEVIVAREHGHEEHGHEEHGHEHGHDEHGHEHDDDDVIEMIHELKAEMRELRKMMAEIKKSLAARAKAAPKARMLPTLIREESAEPRRRYRRRETR